MMCSNRLEHTQHHVWFKLDHEENTRSDCTKQSKDGYYIAGTKIGPLHSDCRSTHPAESTASYRLRIPIISAHKLDIYVAFSV